MFKLVTEIVAPWPVSIETVQEDGSIRTEEFKAHFLRVPESEFQAIFAPMDPLSGEEVRAHNRKVIDRIMKGWSDVVGADGKELPFTPDHIDRLLDFPNIGHAITIAFARFHRAQPEEREKNSAPSPAGTPAAADPPEAAGLATS